MSNEKFSPKDLVNELESIISHIKSLFVKGEAISQEITADPTNLVSVVTDSESLVSEVKDATSSRSDAERLSLSDLLHKLESLLNLSKGLVQTGTSLAQDVTTGVSTECADLLSDVQALKGRLSKALKALDKLDSKPKNKKKAKKTADPVVADVIELVVDKPLQPPRLEADAEEVPPEAPSEEVPQAKVADKKKVDYKAYRKAKLAEKVTSKKGTPYSEFRSQIKPLDLVLFKGGDFVSDTIRFIEKEKLGDGDFSHTGIIITTEVYNHPHMVDGKIYILESTVTGFLGCGVKNIDNKSKFCVQITDFDALVEAYDRNPHTAIAISHLLVNPVDADSDSVKKRLQPFIDRMLNTSYCFNFYTLLSAIFPFMRLGRKIADGLMGSGKWVFCSELVFMVYQQLGIYSLEFNPKDVVPVDFLGYDEDGIPLVVEKEPTYIVSHRWA